MIRLFIAVAAAGIALAGCSSTQLASTPRSVTMANVYEFNIAETTAAAQTHCQQYGRDAEMIPDDRADGNVTFRCVDA